MNHAFDQVIAFLSDGFGVWLLLNAKGLALLAIVAVIAACAARASAATRHLLWEGALIAILLVPAAGLILPAQAVPVWQAPAPATTETAAETVPAVPIEPMGEIVAIPSHEAGPSHETAFESMAPASETSHPPALSKPDDRDPVSATSAAVAHAAPSVIEESPLAPETIDAPAPVRPAPAVTSAATAVAAPAVLSAPAVSFGQLVAAAMLIVWAAGAAGLLARLAVVLLALVRLRRQSQPVSGGGVFTLLMRTARELGVRRPIRLVVARDRTIPMVWGIFRPTLLLPEAFLDWPTERLRLVLAHEASHVRRGDAFVDLAAQVACSLYWMNPLAWFALSRLRLEREQACDDLVLELAARPSLYAETLLSVASGVGSSRLAPHAALLMARPSQVEHRLQALLDETRNRARLSKPRILAGVLAAGAIVALLGSLQPVARSADAPPAVAAARVQDGDSTQPRVASDTPLVTSSPATDSRELVAAAEEAASPREAESSPAAVVVALAAPLVAAADDPPAANVRENAKDTELDWELGQAQIDRGHILWNSGRLKEAVDVWNQSIFRQQGLIRTLGLDGAHRRELAASLAEIAERYAELAFWEEAADQFHRAFLTSVDLSIRAQFAAVAVANALGDRDRYRAWTREMFMRYENSASDADKRLLATALTLGSDPGVEAARVAALVEDLPEHKVVPPRWTPAAVYASLNAGRFAEAEERVRKMPSPRRPGVMAIVEMQRGQKAKAQEQLDRMRLELEDQARRLLAAPPHPVSSRWTDFAEVRALYARAQRAVGGDDAVQEPWLLLLQGRNRLQAGLARGDRDLNGIIAQAPNDFLILTARARVFTELTSFERAEQDFRQAREMAPTEAWPALQQAQAYLERGLLAEAEKVMAAAHALAPKELDLFLRAGWWLAGPYPNSMADAFPPEKSTDISRPLDPLEAAHERPAGTDRETPQRPIRWQRAAPQERSAWFYSFGTVKLTENYRDSLAMARLTREARASLPVFPNASGSMYATTFVYSPKEEEVFFRFGSAGPRRLWVNGDLVNESSQSYPLWNPTERFPIRLRQGLNRLLVKTSGSDNFTARIDDSRVDRGLHLFGTALFEEAAATLEGAMTRPYGSYDWGIAFRAAVAQAAAGNWAGYRQWRDAGWPDLEDGTDQSGAWWIGHLFALSDKDLPPDPARWMEVLKRGLSASDVDPGFARAILALAHLRIGQADEALQVASMRAAVDYPVTWPVLALIHHQAGNAAEARRYLERSDRWWTNALDKSLAAPVHAMPITGPYWTPFVVIHREAQAKILNAEPPKEPLWYLFAGRFRGLHARDGRFGLKDLDTAVAIRPEDADVWIRRARVFSEIGMASRVPADLDKAAALAKTPADRLGLARAAARGYQAARHEKNPTAADECRTRALAALRAALEGGQIDSRTLVADTDLKPLMAQPEFQALLK